MRLVPVRRFEMRPWQHAENRVGWMDRFFEDFFTESNEGGFVPSLDISETKKDFVIKAELPGMDADNIDLTVDKGVLTISGERKEEKTEEDENCYCRETSYGSFRRSVRLPTDVDAEKIAADYKNGMLKVKLPKLNGKDKKVIKIEAK
jgi:HSP20 family protein